MAGTNDHVSVMETAWRCWHSYLSIRDDWTPADTVNGTGRQPSWSLCVYWLSHRCIHAISHSVKQEVSDVSVMAINNQAVCCTARTFTPSLSCSPKSTHSPSSVVHFLALYFLSLNMQPGRISTRAVNAMLAAACCIADRDDEHTHLWSHFQNTSEKVEEMGNKWKCFRPLALSHSSLVEQQINAATIFVILLWMTSAPPPPLTNSHHGQASSILSCHFPSILGNSSGSFFFGCMAVVTQAVSRTQTHTRGHTESNTHSLLHLALLQWHRNRSLNRGQWRISADNMVSSYQSKVFCYLEEIFDFFFLLRQVRNPLWKSPARLSSP